MGELSLKKIKVNYGSAIVNGTVRDAQVKTWEVAVNTITPEDRPVNHATWMLDVQFLRAETTRRIGELECQQIIDDTRPYMNGLK